jgi:hypothetical protein
LAQRLKVSKIFYENKLLLNIWQHFQRHFVAKIRRTTILKTKLSTNSNRLQRRSSHKSTTYRRIQKYNNIMKIIATAALIASVLITSDYLLGYQTLRSGQDDSLDSKTETAKAENDTPKATEKRILKGDNNTKAPKADTTKAPKAPKDRDLHSDTKTKAPKADTTKAPKDRVLHSENNTKAPKADTIGTKLPKAPKNRLLIENTGSYAF